MWSNSTGSLAVALARSTIGTLSRLITCAIGCPRRLIEKRQRAQV